MGAVDVFLRALALDAVLIDAIGQSAQPRHRTLISRNHRDGFNDDTDFEFFLRRHDEDRLSRQNFSED